MGHFNISIDYCNALLAAAPQVITDKLPKVLNAAARVLSGTKKYDQGLSRLLHEQLHWLDVPDHVNYTSSVSVGRMGKEKGWNELSPVHTSNNVEATFDFVERIVPLVFDNVAWTLVLMWTGLLEEQGEEGNGEREQESSGTHGNFDLVTLTFTF